MFNKLATREIWIAVFLEFSMRENFLTEPIGKEVSIGIERPTSIMLKY